MTYNIQHGEGTDGRIDLARIADLILRERADVVALQEVDRGVARTGQRDLPAELAQLTGMSCVFSNNFYFQGGEYGNALLSRLPIKRWHNTHYEMLREGEQRGLLQVELDVGGRTVMVMNTHVDYRRDDAERLSNIGEIMTIASTFAGIPVIVCGDFNSLPGSRTHQAMKSRFLDAWEESGTGEGFTFPSGGPVRRIDYIFCDGHNGLTPVMAWVTPSPASDHLPMTAEFQWR